MLDLGFDHAGGGLVDEVADLELGGAEELPVGSGGEQLGHLAEFALGGGDGPLVEDLGALLLLGGQVGVRHGVVRVYR
jgi:hypothetical protein